MKVILAETAGFCKGVRRAMNKVLEQSEQNPEPIYTDGPLIHNPQTIEVLERRGVRVLPPGEEARPGEMVFIRTHGVSPARRAEIGRMGATVCDATCPDVARIQGLIRRHARKGYMVVIVGDRKHAEVIGLAGYAGQSGHVINTPEEVAGLPDAQKVCVVAQSTLEQAVYREVTTAVSERYEEVLVLDTICPSTYNRQNEVDRLSRESDAVVVVGGRNSANTRHLVQISGNNGTPTFHVETAAEIDPAQMSRFKTVAVTAGASTPNWILMEVVERLKEIEPEGTSGVTRRLRAAAVFIARSNIYVALGAAVLCYANARLMGLSLGWLPYTLSFCYILSVHLMAHFTDRGALALKKPATFSEGTRTHPRLYAAMALISAALALLMAGVNGAASFMIMVLLLLLGLVYHIDLPLFTPPVGGKKLSLRLIPASKDLFMGLGWAFVTVFYPLFLREHSFASPAFPLTFTGTFLLVTIRSLFFDVRDIQGDKIVGRETLPTIIGTRGSVILILSLAGIYGLLMAAGSALGWLGRLGWAMPLVTAFICLYVFLYHRRLVHRETPVEVLGNTQFLLAGVLALLFS